MKNHWDTNRELVELKISLSLKEYLKKWERILEAINELYIHHGLKEGWMQNLEPELVKKKSSSESLSAYSSEKASLSSLLCRVKATRGLRVSCISEIS